MCVCSIFQKKKKSLRQTILKDVGILYLKQIHSDPRTTYIKKNTKRKRSSLDILSPEHFELNLNYPHIQVSFVKQYFPQINTMGLIPDSFYLYYYYYRRSNACYHQHLRYHPFVVRYRGSCRRRHRLQ